MWKRMAALGASAAILLLSCTNIQCKASIDGQLIDGYYSPAQLDRCLLAATMAAEEILPGEASLPLLKKSYRLSFKLPEGSDSTLIDALLQATQGIELVDMVYVNGERLGSVEDSAQLFERLRSFIRSQMPLAAVSGTISGELSIRHRYSRQAQHTAYGDMVLLISGMAPVIYISDSGKLV